MLSSKQFCSIRFKIIGWEDGSVSSVFWANMKTPVLLHGSNSSTEDLEKGGFLASSGFSETLCLKKWCGEPLRKTSKIDLAFTYAHTHSCIHTHTCIYTHVHTYTHTCMHSHTDTHTINECEEIKANRQTQQLRDKPGRLEAQHPQNQNADLPWDKSEQAEFKFNSEDYQVHFYTTARRGNRDVTRSFSGFFSFEI